MKIKINGYLKDLTNQELLKINTNAIKTNQKLSYHDNEEYYTLKTISPTKLILTRKTTELECTYYFELNKVIPTIYYIKNQELSLEIDIKTTNIEINDKNIKINYNVVDSNIKYEYYIEMSE